MSLPWDNKWPYLQGQTRSYKTSSTTSKDKSLFRQPRREADLCSGDMKHQQCLLFVGLSEAKLASPVQTLRIFTPPNINFLRKVWVCRIVCYRKLSDTGPQSVPPSNRVFQMLLDVPRSTLFEAYWVTSAATRIWSLTGGIGRFCLWNTRPSRGWANLLSPSFEHSDKVTFWYQTFYFLPLIISG